MINRTRWLVALLGPLAVSLAWVAPAAQCTTTGTLQLERIPGPPNTVTVFLGQSGGRAVVFDAGLLAFSAPNFAPLSGNGEVGEVVIYEEDPTGPHAWNLLQTLESPGSLGNWSFGESLDLEGDLLVVGEPEAGVLSNGRVVLFERDGGGSWSHLKNIGQFDGTGQGRFGLSVALSGDVLAVRAPGTGTAGTRGTYLYGRDLGTPNGWGLLKKLNDDPPTSLDLHDDLLVVGYADDTIATSGGVRIHQRDAGGPDQWGELTTIAPFDGQADDWFGYSVALDDEHLLVGAPRDDERGTDSGSAYLYGRGLGGPNAFGLVAKLTASDADAGAEFARRLDVDQDCAAISHGNHDHQGFIATSVHLFQRNAGGPGAWNEVEELRPYNDGLFQGGFSAAVAVAGQEGLTFVGAPFADDGLGNFTGACFVFGPGTEATVAFRNSSGPVNPASLSASPALLGEDLQLTVDLSSTGHTQAWPFAFDTAVEIPLGGGQVLLCLDGGAGRGEMLGIGAPLPGPQATTVVAVPNLPSLCGVSLSVQALHLGNVLPYALSNAQDLVLGTGT